MRIVICWPHISGYIAACWRALARTGVELHILALGSESKPAPPAAGGSSAGLQSHPAPFDSRLIDGLHCRLLNADEQDDSATIAAWVLEQKPDVLVLPGWFHPAYVALARHPRLRDVPRVMAMDTPWKLPLTNWAEGLRQILGRIWLRRYLAGMAMVVVPGERSWQYARLLNIPEKRLMRGAYGIDYDAFAPLYAQRRDRPEGWPKRFLYMGRYEPIKGIDVLLEAHAKYCGMVGADAWPLTCCGSGAEKSRLTDAARKSPALIDDRGFVQPPDQPPILRECGVSVLASRFDPWPLVIVEACAAGFPILCTEACGSAVENVRPHYNGLLAATGDVDSLAHGMHWLHTHAEVLPEWGHRSQHFAAAYSADVWACRWRGMLERLK